MYYKIIDYSSYRMVSYPVSAPWSIWRRSSKMWKVDSLRTQTQAHARIQEGEVGREGGIPMRLYQKYDDGIFRSL